MTIEPFGGGDGSGAVEEVPERAWRRKAAAGSNR